MKRYSRMIIMLLALALGHAALTAGSLRAGQNEAELLRTALREEAAAVFEQHGYAEFLPILEQRRRAAQNEAERNYVTYYQLLTQSSYLDYLEQEEMWKEYYELRKEFDAHIIATVRDVPKKYPVEAVVVDMQFLAWRAQLREENVAGAAAAFDELADMLFSFTAAAEDQEKFQEIAALVAQVGSAQQLNELLVRYRDYVLRHVSTTTSGEHLRQLAEKYRAAGDVDIAVTILKMYAQLVLESYSRANAMVEIRSVIDSFAATGFGPAPEAEVAEKLYQLAEEKFGADVWQEHDVFVRAVNLELAGRNPEAVTMYTRFAASFPQSPLLAEVETRRGFVLLFRLNDPLNGVLAWENVATRFADSPLANFCRYWAGVYSQWKGESPRARGLLQAIPESNWPYGAMARQRLTEIEAKGEVDRPVFTPFDRVFNVARDNPVEMALAVNPGRVFLDQDVIFEGSAQDFSAGTVQPQFTYEWFGQVGQAGMPGNAPSFTTRYQTPGPQLVWMGAKTENTEGAIAQLAWNYEIAVTVPESGGRIAARQLATFAASFEPPLPDLPQLSWTWEFSGPVPQSVPGREVKIQFDEPGAYRGVVRVRAGERSWEKQFTLEVVP